VRKVSDSWLRLSVADLSARRPWFNSRPVLVKFVMYVVTLGQVLLPYLLMIG